MTSLEIVGRSNTTVQNGGAHPGRAGHIRIRGVKHHARVIRSHDSEGAVSQFEFYENKSLRNWHDDCPESHRTGRKTAPVRATVRTLYL
jgi:hypothetical protein